MNLTAGAQLRSLVDGATPISVAIAALSRNAPHPISAGIKAKKSYSTDVGKFALPNTGPGLQRLRELTSRSIPGLSAIESRGAWGSLMQSPGLVLVNRYPAGGDWETEDPRVAPENLRQLTLVSVYRHDDEALEAGVAKNARFAGVGTLTLALSATDGGSSNAWLTATWHDSTRSFMGALERAFDVSGIAPTSTGIAITVIFDSDEVAITDERKATIRNSAAVAGVNVRFYNLPAGQQADFISRAISRQVPNQLFAVGTGPKVEAVANTFGSAHGFERVVRALAGTPDDVVQDLRERFAAAVGVSPSLQVQTERNTGVAPKSEMLPFPFPGDPGICLHLDDGHRYISDPATGLYWTRDTANHGKVPFKTYKRTNTLLTFEADRDAKGDKITAKTKGEVLYRIELAKLNPCSNPRTHKG